MKAIQLALAVAWYYWIINCVSESRRLTWLPSAVYNIKEEIILKMLMKKLLDGIIF